MENIETKSLCWLATLALLFLIERCFQERFPVPALLPLTKFHNFDFGMGRHVTSKATRIMTQPNSDKSTGSITATSEQIQHDFAANDIGKRIVAPPD